MAEAELREEKRETKQSFGGGGPGGGMNVMRQGGWGKEVVVWGKGHLPESHKGCDGPGSLSYKSYGPE